MTKSHSAICEREIKVALIQKDIPAPIPHNILEIDNSQNAKEASLTVDTDAQDEELWAAEFAASQDTLSRLARQSRAHREAGRTKKIGS